MRFAFGDSGRPSGALAGLWRLVPLATMAPLSLVTTSALVVSGPLLVLWWVVVLVLVAIPLLTFEASFASALRGTAVHNLKRVRRSLALLGVGQMVIIFLLAVLCLVLAVWVWTVSVDALLDIFAGRPLAWEQGVAATHTHHVHILGQHGVQQTPQSISMWLSPLGGVMVMNVLLWLVVHQCLRRSLAWLLWPLAVCVVIALALGLLAWFGQPALTPFALQPWSLLAAGDGQVWWRSPVEVISWCFLAAAIGTALMGTGILSHRASSDIGWNVVAVCGVGVVFFALWLGLAGLAISHATVGEPALLSTSSSPSPVMMLTLIPRGAVQAFPDSGVGHLWALSLMMVLGLWALISGIVLLRACVASLEKDGGMDSSDAHTRVVVVGILSCLPMASVAGVMIWEHLLDGLRLLALPLLALAVVVMVHRFLGLAGIMDHLRSRSSLPFASTWVVILLTVVAMLALWYLPLALWLTVVGDGSQWSWLRLFALIPTLLVILVFNVGRRLPALRGLR